MGETTASTRVLLVDDDQECAAAAAGHLGGASDNLVVETATSPDDALDRLSETAFDCVVSDWEVAETGGAALLAAIREEHGDRPVIVFTNADCEAVVSDALAAGATDYLRKRAGTGVYELLATRIDHAVERYRASTSAVDRIGRLTGAVGRELIRAETRAEIERLVCDAVDDAGTYPAAWIGEYDPDRRVVEPRAAASLDTSRLDDVDIATDGGPTGRAVRTEAPVAGRDPGDIAADSRGEDAVDHEYPASVAVPLCSDGDCYGVLRLYADHTDAFGEREREVLTELGTDIATAIARVEAQACRERRNQQFRSAVEHAGHVVLITDEEGQITFVNDTFESVTGYTASEAIGRQPSMLQSGHHDEEFYRDLWATVSSGEVWEGEVVNERKDGSQYVIDQTIAPITDDGGIAGFVAINREITARKERELNLAFLKRAIDQAGIGIGTYGSDGHATYVNERLAELFGTDREELRTQHMSSLDPGLDRERFPEYWASFHDGERRIYDTQVERLDTGERFPVEVVTSRVRIDDDVYQVNTVRDATERNRQNRDLERFRSAVEHAGHGVLITDADGHIEYVNDAFETMSGYTAAEAIGRTPALIQSGKHDEAFYRDLWETILDGDVWQGEVTNERKDGERYVVDQTIAPITDDEGNLTGFVAINRDVSELKAYEHELETQNDRLKQYGQTVAHDLRNPLALLDAELKQFRATIDGGEVDADEVRDLCASIGSTVERMEALIEDLLAMAEHGQRVLDAETVSLEAVTRSAWSQLDLDAAELSVQDADIDADPDRLRELLSNLFRNSVEHGSTSSRSKTGDVADDEVHIRVQPLDFSTGFAVEDDGPGIPPDERDDVFDRGFTTTADGTGFGLAIVECIAESHGWTVSVTEGRDGGARFEFRVDGPA